MTVSHWLQKAFLFTGVQLSSNLCKARETKQNPAQLPHTNTGTHTHILFFPLQTEIHSHEPNYADAIQVSKKNEDRVECIPILLSDHNEVTGQQSTWA